MARNICADYFLRQTSATHLLFIDADMRFRADDVLRLLRHGDRDIVAAMCPGKDYDWERIAHTARTLPNLDPKQLPLFGARYTNATALEGNAIHLDHTDASGLIEVSGIGTGLMLIRRDVFTRLAQAHPHWRVTQSGILQDAHLFFEGGRVGGGFLGEDLSFCAAVRAIGGQVFAAPWFRIGHIGNHEFVGEPDLSHPL